MKKTIYLALLLTTLLSAKQNIDLSSLSLEELFDIKVSTTSRRDESQHMAPGVVTVITSQDINKYGARNLRDVIDRVVGVLVVGSHQRPHNKASIRAMNGAHQEGWEVILINGRPIHDGTDGGFNFDIYQGFPVDMIERIEIIRGPGSVVYGTNAMAGVINIITKNMTKQIIQNRIDVSAGTFDRKQIQLMTLLGDEDYSLNIALNAIRAKGDSINNITDSYGATGTYDMGRKSDNLVVNGKYHGFAINGMLMKNDSDSFGSRFYVPSSKMQKERQFLDLGYTYELNNKWDISLNYTINKGEFDWAISNSGKKNHYDDQYDMFEMIIRGKITDELNVLLGANRSSYESKFQSGLLDSRVNNKSAYLQIDYLITETQKIIGGIQINKPEDTQRDISSRFGYMNHFADNMWLKLLYSEAYRSPNLQETKIDASTLKGNPGLKPEKVATYDLQLIYQEAKYYVALSVYDSVLKNVIVRTSGTPTTFTNQGEIHYQGVEFEARGNLANGFNVIGNFSYQTNKTDTGIKNSTFAPKTMAKIGFNYDAIDGVDISAFNSYIGKSTDLTQTNATPLRNTKPKAYNLLSMKASLDTTKIWNIGEAGHSYVALYLDNLLDEKIFAPDLDYTKGSNTIPAHWGRSANLIYTYKF